ncbi:MULTISPECIES: DUF881 domain-containing protein [Paraliobacillus]|uniref:DUF881 domain-containing protein n=1 Tax=Paraliobacillus TaxID=200903 RepID=UPI001E3283BC|nr:MULTISPECIES: DUF881 domain-containing protein [Paraliobacillus]
MKLRGKHVVLSFVLFIFGFLVAFSYQNTKEQAEVIQLSQQEWEKDFYYRQQLLQFEEQSLELQEKVDDYRQEISTLEESLGEQETAIGEYVETKRKLQILTGELPITGPGIRVTLSDANYIPTAENANQYIVHDRHVQLVINELYSAGAKAIAINGQRIYKDSYVTCIGPVISVDGKQYPAPFSIEAIGEQETLEVSLELKNGVIDMLVNDNVEVEVGTTDQIAMDARVN